MRFVTFSGENFVRFFRAQRVCRERRHKGGEREREADTESREGRGEMFKPKPSSAPGKSQDEGEEIPLGRTD
jgi:hypothetical protein